MLIGKIIPLSFECIRHQTAFGSDEIVFVVYLEFLKAILLKIGRKEDKNLRTLALLDHFMSIAQSKAFLIL
jgi:hypothetical protein